MKFNQKGYSLIEVSLVISIVFVILLSVSPFFKLASNEVRVALTVKRMNKITVAVSSYLISHKNDIVTNILKKGSPYEISIEDLINGHFLMGSSSVISKDGFGNSFHIIVWFDSSGEQKKTEDLMAIVTATNDNNVNDIPVDMRGKIVSHLGNSAGLEPISGSKSKIFGVSKNWTVNLQDWKVGGVDYNKAQYFYFIKMRNIIDNNVDIYKTDAGVISKVSLEEGAEQLWSPVFTDDKLFFSLVNNIDIDFFSVIVTPSTDGKVREYKVFGDKLIINPESAWLPLGNIKDVTINFKVKVHYRAMNTLSIVKEFTIKIKNISIIDYFKLFFSTGELSVKGWALERQVDGEPIKTTQCNTMQDIQLTKVNSVFLSSAMKDDLIHELLAPITIQVSVAGDNGVHGIIYRLIIDHAGSFVRNISLADLDGGFDISDNTCGSYLNHQVKYELDILSNGGAYKMNSVTKNWNGDKSAFSINIFP